MGSVFISHSSADNDIARRLKTRLEDRGYRGIFLDFDRRDGLPGGKEWEAELYRALRRADALVAIVSPSFNESKWCFSEVTVARVMGKPVIPIRTDLSDLPQLLSRVQAVDMASDTRAGLQDLDRALRQAGLDPDVSAAWDARRPPYPGLLPLDERDAGVFFGRSSEVKEVMEALSRSARLGSSGFVLLLGASGSGKSSVLRAGVVAQMRRDLARWVIVGPFRPRTDPDQEFVAAMARARAERASQDVSDASPALPPSEALDELRRASGEFEAQTVLVIDQFEELLTPEGGAASESFLQKLRDVADEQRGTAIVLATLRSDFLSELQMHSIGRELAFETVLVGPLGAAQREQAIVQPARMADVQLEPELIRALLEETQAPNMLPLLAHTLRELYDSAHQAGELGLRDLTSLGGVQGAIAGAAEQALPRNLPRDEETALRHALLRMVRLDENGRYVRRSMPWRTAPSQSHAFLERLVRARLLVSSDDGADRRLEVAHEALFTAWNRLAQWLVESRSDMLLLRQVETATALWRDSGHSSHDLWRGERIAQAQTIVDAEHVTLTDDEASFLAASAEAEAGNQRRRAREVEYRLARSEALENYVTPYLQARRAEIEAEVDLRALPANRRFRTDSQVQDLRNDLQVLDGLLSSGRWHPAEPVYVRNLGATDDYVELFRFPCCGVHVIRLDAPQRFRADGCEEDPTALEAETPEGSGAAD